MKKFLQVFFLFALINDFSAIYGQSIQNRYPTQKELEAKLSALKNPGQKNKNGLIPVFPLITGPEQDCSGAIAVCQQTYTQPNSYTGYGSTQEVYNNCLLQGEQYSVWYVFTVQNSGTFIFTIQTQDDYDFALYDITSIGCSGVPSATPVRCNYSATYGNTGIELPTSSTIPLSYTASQTPMMPGLDVTAGITYALIIDNFSQNNNGYTLTFGGTAQIYDITPPSLSTAAACAGNVISLTFSEPVQCTSVNPSGNDFVITGPGGNVPILSASGSGCGTLTSQVDVIFSNIPAIASGTYTISVATSGIQDKCGNAIAGGDSLTFDYLGAVSISTPNSTICIGDSTALSVNGASTGASYSWSNGSSADSIIVNPSFSTTYSVTVTAGGCSRTALQTITVATPPLVSVNPLNVTICSGTTSITATSVLNGSSCSNCSYTWSGSVTQTDNNVPSSTVINADTGSYTVNVISPSGCVGNTVTATVNGPASPPLPSCNLLYVSTSGTGNGLTRTSPTDLITALNLSQCNNVVIKMAEGTYTITSPITNLTSFVTLEGGYDPAFSSKSSLAGKTVIFRTNATVQGQPGSPRLVAFEISGQSNFRLQDITIQVDNAPAPSATEPLGVSTYGLRLTNCSNYDIVRCRVIAGNASAGLDGSVGTDGVKGGNGGNGTGGNNDDQCESGAGGGGGGGAGTAVGLNGNNASGNGPGATAGAAGSGGGGGGNGGTGAKSGSCSNGWFGSCSGCTTGVNGGTGSCSSGLRMGGGGGGGASGGHGDGPSNGGVGGNGGGVASACTAQSTGGGAGIASGCNSISVCTTNLSGKTGADGNNGSIGSAGNAGTPGTVSGGFWNPGSQANTGTDGDGGQGGKGGGGGGGEGSGSCIDGAGSGGGGGGGGGSGGTGGTGGYGGGSSFAIFLFSNGTGGKIDDCQLQAGAQGPGGQGGAGGQGGIGGNPGLGSTYMNDDVGCGGNGGKGGNGGTGGDGGDGSPGLSQAIYTDGNALVTSDSTFDILNQQEIIMENISCTNTDIDFSSSGLPAWTNFGSGASPSSGSGSPSTTQYLTTGRKTVAMNASDYSDFVNILVGPPTTGAITVNTSSMCPGTEFFSYNQSGNPGLSYQWSVSPAAVIISSTAGSTNISFLNTDTVTITYTITLDILSECCGPLTPLTYTMDVHPVAPDPVVTGDTVCDAGTATLIANAANVSNFYWYNSGGTLLGTGQVFTYGPVSSTDTVFVEATNADGCNSNLVAVPFVIEPPQAPSVQNAIMCDTGIVFVTVNPPMTGATGYTWYDQLTGGILLQSGNSYSYGIYLPLAGSSDTVYVSAIIPGCNEGIRAMAIASVDTNLFSFAPVYDTICPGASATLDIGVGGAYGNFSYLWSPVPSPDDTLPNPTVSPTSSTTYSVQIISATCTTTAFLPLIVSDQIILNDSTTDALCNAGSDGTATVSVAGGTAPYSFLWSANAGSQTSVTATGLSAGTYSVTMTDAQGCVSTTSITISQPALLSVTTSATSVLCYGASDGTATVAPSGGILPYSYSWGASTGNQSSPTATGLSAGVHSVTVADSNNCLISVSVLVSSLPAITSIGGSTTTKCYQDSTGKATVTSIGGTTPYTYLWSNGQTTREATGLISGTYSVTISDANGCNDTISVFVNEPPKLLLDADSVPLTCNKAQDAQAMVSVQNGGNPPYIYLWSNGQTGATATGLDSGTYVVTVSDMIPCTDSISIYVGVLPPMAPVVTTDSCHGWYDDGNASVDTVVNANYPVSYVWLSGSDTISLSAIANGLDTGTYKVIFTDIKGCKDSLMVGVGLNAVKANFSASPMVGTPPLEVNFTDSSLGNIFSYSWTFGNNNGTSSASSPFFTFQDSGTYKVLLMVSDDGVCWDTISREIEIEKWVIPDIFSPNSDGKNDVFTVVNISIKSMEAKIYNRWGELMHIWTDMANGYWDGRTLSGNIAPEGVYYYIISAIGLDGKEHPPVQGHVTLVR